MTDTKLEMSVGSLLTAPKKAWGLSEKSMRKGQMASRNKAMSGAVKMPTFRLPPDRPDR